MTALFYEEGTPAQIFDSPLKDRTRRFINRLKVFEACFGKSDFDYPGIMSSLEQFCFSHMINRKFIYKIQIVIEELCLNTILPKMDNDRKA